MAKTQRPRIRGSKDGGGSDGPYDRDPYDKEPDEREELDDPGEHLEIERRRFVGGEPPTPERYALAREQWNRLPGAVAKPPMAEGVPPGDDPPKTPADVKKDGQGGDR